MIQRLQKKRNEEGFTLIELLIVIIVLGILAAIVVFAVGSTRDDAAESACKTEVKAVQLSAEAVKVTTGSYPTTEAELVDSSPGGLLKTESDTVAYAGTGGSAAVVDNPATTGVDETAPAVANTGYTITPTPAVAGCAAVSG